eukprot:m.135512 g.135512  ORF g.135512 m.135512 type:complete len:119 (-) comp17555_c0_seq63:4984-5340(-)
MPGRQKWQVHARCLVTPRVPHANSCFRCSSYYKFTFKITHSLTSALLSRSLSLSPFFLYFSLALSLAPGAANVLAAYKGRKRMPKKGPDAEAFKKAQMIHDDAKGTIAALEEALANAS